MTQNILSNTFRIKTFSNRKVDGTMAHLLHIDTSIRAEGSVSREVSGAFAEHWRAANPTGTYVYRDLGLNPVPHLDLASYTAGSTAAEARTPEQEAAAALTDQLINELVDADTVLLGVPMYNYSIPSGLKAWLDWIITPRTMTGAEEGKGLLAGKQVVVVNARGGAYGEGTPRADFEYQERYLRAVLSKIGLAEDLTFVNAEFTLAETVPALAAFIDHAAASRQKAHLTVRELVGISITV